MQKVMNYSNVLTHSFKSPHRPLYLFFFFSRFMNKRCGAVHVGVVGLTVHGWSRRSRAVSRGWDVFRVTRPCRDDQASRGRAVCRIQTCNSKAMACEHHDRTVYSTHVNHFKYKITERAGSSAILSGAANRTITFLDSSWLFVLMFFISSFW